MRINFFLQIFVNLPNSEVIPKALHASVRTESARWTMRDAAIEPTACDIAACDAGGATIFRATLAPLERLHLEESAHFHNRWVDFHEHGRPSRLGQGPTANAAQHYADEHREPLELRRRFAKDLAAWLRDAARAAPSAHLPVFVAPRLLGALRTELADDIDGIELFRAELHGLRAHEVAAHPTVHALLCKALLPHPQAASARPQSDR